MVKRIFQFLRGITILIHKTMMIFFQMPNSPPLHGALRMGNMFLTIQNTVWSKIIRLVSDPCAVYYKGESRIKSKAYL
jgi:hypothetical protein